MHRCVLLFVCREVSIPVALAYTTLACGSLFCRSSTALPIFVDEAFLALWHSSKIICDRERSRPTVLTPKMYQIPFRYKLFSFLFLNKRKDTTPSKSGLHQSWICLILVRCCPPAWLSPISAEYVANRTPSEVAVSPYLICNGEQKPCSKECLFLFLLICHTISIT